MNMSNHDKVLELREQIKGWDREIENLEEMVEAAYHRIDELVEEEERK
jgi:hypothetical protein